MTPRIVVIHVDHPDVEEYVRPPGPGEGSLVGPALERARHAEQLRAAGRAAAHRAAGLFLPGHASEGVLRLVHDAAGAPRMLAQHDGRLIDLPLGLSLTHAVDWGAALMWRLAAEPPSRSGGGPS